MEKVQKFDKNLKTPTDLVDPEQRSRTEEELRVYFKELNLETRVNTSLYYKFEDANYAGFLMMEPYRNIYEKYITKAPFGFLTKLWNKQDVTILFSKPKIKKKILKKLIKSLNCKIDRLILGALSPLDIQYVNINRAFTDFCKISHNLVKEVYFNGQTLTLKKFASILISGYKIVSFNFQNCHITSPKPTTSTPQNSLSKTLNLSYPNPSSLEYLKSPDYIPKILKTISLLPCIRSLCEINFLGCFHSLSELYALKKKFFNSANVQIRVKQEYKF
ncbi:unnamed protein product [Moneuplotes crassus]|uniref:Uncharacterized protein n=1 Tax=Euplotes crassus TaxID=5936 RepID=A0AAD2D2N1_EUPCR|nr:unnamed protein product [Moneuplotes crassus]